MNQEDPDVHSGCRKGRGTRDQIASIHWIIEKARGLQKEISALLIMLKSLTVDHSKLWKSPKEMGIPYCLTSLLRKLGQGAAFRIRHRTDWFKTRKVALLATLMTRMTPPLWLKGKN